MTGLRLWLPFFKLVIPALAAWTACEVALYAGIDVLIERGLK